jgi:hypothetical protein
MRRPIHIAFVPAICLLMAGQSPGADVALVGGNVTLTIQTAIAGQQPAPAENEACALSWTTLPTDPTTKITIWTSLAAAHFVLRAQPNDVVHGMDADEVTLSTTPHDFVTDIPPDVNSASPGQCTISYTASATAAEGSGTDNHNITFTITAQ